MSKCRTWRWCSGDSARIRGYLPTDKQFLLIQGCLSTKRVKDVTNPGNIVVDNNEEMVEGGWMVRFVYPFSLLVHLNNFLIN